MKNEMMNEISNTNKGVFGVHVTAMTEPKMNKRNNPFYGRVHKVTDYFNIQLGTSYANTVNNRLERNGGEGNYVAEKAKGMHEYNDFFMQSDSDPEQFYLSIIFNRCKSHTESVFMVDGRLATEEEIKEFTSFMPSKPSECKKQADAGLSEEEQVEIRRIKLQNVLKVRIGDRVIGE